MGYAPATAGGVLVWSNTGALLGALLLSILSWRIGIRALSIGAMLGSFVAVLWFGQGQSNLDQLGFVAATAGFCANAGVVGLYAIFAATFPTEVRASGNRPGHRHRARRRGSRFYCGRPALFFRHWRSDRRRHLGRWFTMRGYRTPVPALQNCIVEPKRQHDAMISHRVPPDWPQAR